MKRSNKNPRSQKTSALRPSLPSSLASSLPTKPYLELVSSSLPSSRPLESFADLHSFSYAAFCSQSHLPHPEEETCPICMVEFSEADSGHIVKLGRCEGHFFHRDCIEMCHQRLHLKCPICGLIYGIMTGDMPDGVMIVMKYPKAVAQMEGFEHCDVLEIQYHMSAGRRGLVQFPGTNRIAYLPDNADGREVLRLFAIAFERRLTFTIGTSVTTGRENQIVWNGIHHKTALGGGIACFGFPDDTYFNRVKEELAAKGIFS
jgi:deltex